MRTDEDLKREIEALLRLNRLLDKQQIWVEVSEGIVVLGGWVASHIERANAEAAARSTCGVAAVANDIQVSLPPGSKDSRDIAREAIAALRAQLPSAYAEVIPVVDRGRITLEGELEWNHQRETAARAVQQISGIYSVDNLIVLRPKVEPRLIKLVIEDAFHQNAEAEAQNITVESERGAVTLRGQVSSAVLSREAERVTLSVPGVTRVNNNIVVGAS